MGSEQAQPEDRQRRFPYGILRMSEARAACPHRLTYVVRARASGPHSQKQREPIRPTTGTEYATLCSISASYQRTIHAGARRVSVLHILKE